MTQPADGPAYLLTHARTYANMRIQSEYRVNISGGQQSTSSYFPDSFRRTFVLAALLLFSRVIWNSCWMVFKVNSIFEADGLGLRLGHLQVGGDVIDRTA